MGQRINLLGTWIDSVSLQDAGALVAEFVRTGTPHQVIPANVDFLRLAKQDSEFRAIVNGADLVVADGMPLVWASRLAGHGIPRRIAGVDMILMCAEVAAAKSFRIFLLGAEPGVGEGVAEVLRARFPGLPPVCTYAPPPLPLSAQEEEHTIRVIREAQPHILIVAFGAPLQERWIAANRERLGVPVCMGVGGAFDMMAGRVRRAPLWMQRRGLEWSFRLLHEPRRLWRRYLVHDLPVFMQLMTQNRPHVAPRSPVANPVMLVDDALPDLARLEESAARVG